MPLRGLSRVFDSKGNVVQAMCCTCFNFYEIVPAREGGMWTTESDGSVIDVCIYCSAKEYLREAYAMNA